jgi:hypothetical protein
MERPISRATASTAERSVLPSSLGGVGTATKTTREEFTASAVSVVNERRPWRTLRSTRSSRPGS